VNTSDSHGQPGAVLVGLSAEQESAPFVARRDRTRIAGEQRSCQHSGGFVVEFQDQVVRLWRT